MLLLFKNNFWILGLFLRVQKMKFLSTLRQCLEIQTKKLNAKDKYMCYVYKESQIFEFIWSQVLPKTNAEDMESQSAQHLWSNCNSLVLRVKSSSSNRDGFFSNKYNCCGHPVFENQKYYVIQKLSSLYQFILEIQQILESHDLKGHANI